MFGEFGSRAQSGLGSKIAFGGMQLIGKKILTASTATITFSSIPANFNHLQIRIQCRCDLASAAGTIRIIFNNDTSSIYDFQELDVAGTATGAGAATAFAQGDITLIPGTTNTTSYFAQALVDIHNYTGITAFKTWYAIGGFAPNAGNSNAGKMRQAIGTYRNAAIINRIDMVEGSAANFISGSSFYLYGII